MVLALCPSPGQVLLHTKAFYPAGVYRLPSGGVHRGEPVEEAMRREMWEEMGLLAEAERLVGLIEYRVRHGVESFVFASWVFLLQPQACGAPQCHDAHEQITDFRAVPLAELRAVASQLRTLPRPWREWGQFRAPAHELTAAALGL
ncbi:MAG: NUDIX hydrolase [Chloroflexi bacterium]|nr:NUDIX hydrolase [Chloroflexota bacterium]